MIVTLLTTVQQRGQICIPVVRAALAILAFTVALAIYARRARARASVGGDPEAAVLTAGLVAAAITVLGQGLVDYPLRNEVLWFTFWMIVGGLVSSYRISRV